MPLNAHYEKVILPWFFLFLGIIVASCLCSQLYQYPLTDWAVDDLPWTKTWLFTTVLDYYGSTFCLCAIALFNETNIVHGVLWSLGFCLLGSPVCCSYMVYRTWKKTIVFRDTKLVQGPYE